MTRCPQCGAQYSESGDSCTVRFHRLLALDHSHREPWGSRHGLAFAAYALQHPAQHDLVTAERARVLVTRVVVRGEPLAHVIRELRKAPTPRAAAAGGAAAEGAWFPVTIADLGDFDAESYPEMLERWCVAALQPHEGPPPVADFGAR